MPTCLHRPLPWHPWHYRRNRRRMEVRLIVRMDPFRLERMMLDVWMEIIALLENHRLRTGLAVWTGPCQSLQKAQRLSIDVESSLQDESQICVLFQEDLIAWVCESNAGFRQGAPYHHASYAPNRQAYPFGVAPSPHPQQQQQSPWMPPMNHHHYHHDSHPLPPPPPSEQDWICDYCHVASFVTYDEACAHESTCRLRANGPTERKMLDTTTSRRDDSHSLALYDQHRIDSRETEIPEDPTQYFDGTVALAVPSADSEWLSELNCFVREHCVEAFSATEEDIARASKRGKIVLGQVGIRCKFCIHRDTKEKAVAAISYPTTVSGIYESVKRWQRVHQVVCQDVPQNVREKLETLQNTSAWVPTTRQYWADSARSLGMTDSHNGIRFERPPSAPETWVPSNHTASTVTAIGEDGGDAGAEAGFIALPADKDEIPDYVYFLMRQVESCRFTEADRFVARSKGPVGFAGFQCRHCNGHAGLGKYFPLTAKSLATNSTSQNIHAHILKCRKCPPPIKETLVRLKTEKGKSPRLVPGWRREFFDRIWERMHGEKPHALLIRYCVFVGKLNVINVDTC